MLFRSPEGQNFSHLTDFLPFLRSISSQTDYFPFKTISWLGHLAIKPRNKTNEDFSDRILFSQNQFEYRRLPPILFHEFLDGFFQGMNIEIEYVEGQYQRQTFSIAPLLFIHASDEWALLARPNLTSDIMAFQIHQIANVRISNTIAAKLDSEEIDSYRSQFSKVYGSIPFSVPLSPISIVLDCIDKAAKIVENGHYAIGKLFTIEELYPREGRVKVSGKVWSIYDAVGLILSMQGALIPCEPPELITAYEQAVKQLKL